MERPRTEVERSVWRFLSWKWGDIMGLGSSSRIEDYFEVESEYFKRTRFEEKKVRVPFWTSKF